MQLKMKIEERDECIKNLVQKINQIEESVNNLNKKSNNNSLCGNMNKVVLLDRHTQSLSPNQGETTTSGNGESSQVPTVKVHE